MDWAKTAARWDETHLSFGFGAPYIRDFTIVLIFPRMLWTTTRIWHHWVTIWPKCPSTRTPARCCCLPPCFRVSIPSSQWLPVSASRMPSIFLWWVKKETVIDLVVSAWQINLSKLEQNWWYFANNIYNEFSLMKMKISDSFQLIILQKTYFHVSM